MGKFLLGMLGVIGGIGGLLLASQTAPVPFIMGLVLWGGGCAVVMYAFGCYEYCCCGDRHE